MVNVVDRVDINFADPLVELNWLELLAIIDENVVSLRSSTCRGKLGFRNPNFNS